MSNALRRPRSLCLALALVLPALLSWVPGASADQILSFRTRFHVAGAERGGITSLGYVPVTIQSSRFLSAPIHTAASGFLTERYDATGTLVESTDLTFCVDIGHYLDQGKNLGVVDTLTTNPGPADGRNLLGAGWVMNTVVANGQIGNYLTGTTGTVDQAARNAAVQLAIWEIVFDASPGDVTSGDFLASGSGTSYSQAARIANNIVTTWLLLGSPGGAAGWIDYRPVGTGGILAGARTSQDQIFALSSGLQWQGGVAVVPEPSTLALTASGLGIGLLLWWRRGRIGAFSSRPA